MSQIGFMMFALGVSGYGAEQGLGYTASMFHLFTHAFFKSLLFLGAGAVIHLVHSNEMKDMGGLRKQMPLTHGCFLIACLAIAGIPPFSGFFSKEEILLAAYQSHKWVYGVALITSGLTAFYMFRLYFCIFWNKNAPTGPGVHPSIHHPEGTMSMKIPLLILAACVIMTGFIPFSSFVSANGYPYLSGLHLGFSVAPLLLALLGIGSAAWLYKNETARPRRIAAGLGSFYTSAQRSFYVDNVYNFTTKKIIFKLLGKPAAWIDKYVVDGFVNIIAILTGRISAWIKGWQSGKIQNHVLYFFAGVAGLAVIFIYMNSGR
jgi:NADH-quinone oxidoreductase subunit L